MTITFTQRLLPFDEAPAESHMESVRWQPSSEALDALDRLENWLTDPRTHRMTAFAEEAIDAVRKAVAEGKNSYMLKAESTLETLAFWNERAHSEEIPRGLTATEREDFDDTVQELLDCLQERFAGRKR
jgi:hypothetical protein